jgi:hypothetical protein
MGLVPCIETDRELVYYFRFHDQTLDNKTLRAPEYLINDILLGRRQHPYLRITEYDFTDHYTRQDHKTGAYDLYFSPTFVVENASLAWAEGVRLGLIGWNLPAYSGHELSSTHLLSHIDVQKPDERVYPSRCILSHEIRGGKGMVPFHIETFNTMPAQVVPLRVYNDWYMPYSWKAAAYLISKGSPPIWYQLEVGVEDKLLTSAMSNRNLPSDEHLFSVRRLSGERPVVAWDFRNDP